MSPSMHFSVSTLQRYQVLHASESYVGHDLKEPILPCPIATTQPLLQGLGQHLLHGLSTLTPSSIVYCNSQKCLCILISVDQGLVASSLQF